jgi:hypothetical protein
MFGLLRSSGCGLRAAERQAWVAHICGVCLALRHDHGQLARLATNYDAALLSVLYAAQCPTAPAQMRHFCPARWGGSAQVIAVDQPGSRYAGTVALLIAATRLADDIADAEGWARLLPGVATRLSQHWQQQAQRVVASPAITLEPPSSSRTAMILPSTPRRPRQQLARPSARRHCRPISRQTKRRLTGLGGCMGGLSICSIVTGTMPPTGRGAGSTRRRTAFPPQSFRSRPGRSLRRRMQNCPRHLLP